MAKFLSLDEQVSSSLKNIKVRCEERKEVRGKKGNWVACVYKDV